MLRINPVLDPIRDTPTHVQLLRHLVESRGYTSYLEIGCDQDACFSRIEVSGLKIGIDPVRGGTHRMTSDTFFADVANASLTFDLVFIDGLHQATQAMIDILQALTYLRPGGCIVVHDCLPLTEEMQRPRAGFVEGEEAWTGDVWKAVAALNRAAGVRFRVGDFDWGCAVIFQGRNDWRHPLPTKDWLDLTWADYERERKKGSLLHVVDDRELVRWIGVQPR